MVAIISMMFPQICIFYFVIVLSHSDAHGDITLDGNRIPQNMESISYKITSKYQNYTERRSIVNNRISREASFSRSSVQFIGNTRDITPTFRNDLATLRLKRNVGSQILITHHFSQKLISPGQDISLKCASTADKPPRFVWERDGVVISSNTDSRITLGQMMSPTDGAVVSHLNISRVRVEDGGLYSCIAVEGESTADFKARIDIYGPPYIRTLPPIKVQSGKPLKLRCPYYGYPISKLEWEHKGKKIMITSLPQHGRYKRLAEFKTAAILKNAKRRFRRQIYDANEDGVLSLSKVMKEENGDSYTCVIYSPSGEMARRSFEIQVVEAPELDELRLGTGIKEGQIVQITCNIISGDPPIYFSWLKDGKKISPNMKVTERSLDFFSVLMIKKVGLEHCGTYTCVATNHVGKVNQTADLYINVAPKWVHEPTNTSLLLGQRGVVHCHAKGYPAPQTHWMKRDATLGIWRPVLDLAGGGVMSHSNGTLLIEMVSLSDEGMYACNIDNGVGEPLTKNVWISVNKPVHFESSSTNITTKVGLPVVLTCLPMGDNPIRIKWAFNGKPLEFSASRFTTSETLTPTGLKGLVNINYVETNDAGLYECRASNPYGIAVHSVFLTILEPPTPPLDLQVEAVSSRSAKLSWRDTIRTHVQYYNVQYGLQTVSWDAAKTVNVTRQDKDIRQSIDLRDLQPAVDYRVRVASGNQVDFSHYTQPVLFTTQPEVAILPHIRQHLMTCAVNESVFCAMDPISTAPSSSPLAVQVLQTENPGELLVSWLPPPRETHNGVLQGFHVKAVPRILGETGQDESQIKMAKVVSRKGKQETIVSGLFKNTRYAVSVSAFNAAGNGPFSLPVYQTTREGAPEVAPSSVECRGVSSTSLRIAWQPINTLGTTLLGYSVFYSTDESPWVNITSPHTETYLQGLSKYTNYTIKVAAFSNYGFGPFSLPMTCVTLQDVPGSPAAIKVLVSSSTSLLVSWKKPDYPNGEITHYTVYLKQTSSRNTPQSYRVEPPQDSYLPNKHPSMELKNLVEGWQYEVCVTASTKAGEGPPSAVINRELTSRVVAGVSSLGGTISISVGRSLLLQCNSVGSPPPRTVWYHKNNIITHHPRYTRNHDDSLLINNIDQSLSGNYTCLAKNLYGSDSVSYTLVVLPTPEPPRIQVVPLRNSLHLTWDHTKFTTGKQKISYNLTWKEANQNWQDTWSNKGTTFQGTHEYTLDGLKCGTKYSLRMTASNSVGTSQPAYVEVSTLGGLPISPTSTEWFWSNSSHIYIQLSGWDDNGCEITHWDVEYREINSKIWKKAENKFPIIESQWNPYSSILNQPNSFVMADLAPAQWYQIKVSAGNSAGVSVSHFNYATTTVLGETIGPPSDLWDLNMLVIIFSSILLTVCFITCIYILAKRLGTQRATEYRNSLTVESKSERSNVTVNTPQSDVNRVYSTPIHISADTKHELYEISPYAQFAIGFRTFGHVDNQEAPRMQPSSSKSRYDSETSFQVRSESEESDCISRTTTMKSAPRKACRVPHHR